MLMEAERRTVVRYGRAMLRSGLTTGTGGNLSCRGGAHDLVAISPSGVPYDELDPHQVVVVDRDGTRVAGGRRPSSELGFHLALYRHRGDVRGIVHTHSPYATTLACLNWEIPPVHYLVGFAGPKVPVAPYATFGSEALADHVRNTMGTAFNAVLLANHGLVAVGADLPRAFDTAEEVEFAARVFCQAKAIGDPVLLSQAEMARVMAKFETYGRKDATPGDSGGDAPAK
jgi:L-fuculose-phosphate aldolase